MSVSLAFKNTKSTCQLDPTTDDVCVIGFCLVDRGEKQLPAKMALVYYTAAERYHFASGEWFDRKISGAQNRKDRELYEKWQREFQWAKDHVPDDQWGAPQKDAHQAQIINLTDRRLGRSLRLLHASSSDNGPDSSLTL